jgi:hypothetical protein
MRPDMSTSLLPVRLFVEGSTQASSSFVVKNRADRL